MLSFAILLIAAAVATLRALHLIVFRNTLYPSAMPGSASRRVRASDHRFERNAQVVFYLIALAVLAVCATILFR